MSPSFHTYGTKTWTLKDEAMYQIQVTHYESRSPPHQTKRSSEECGNASVPNFTILIKLLSTQVEWLRYVARQTDGM